MIDESFVWFLAGVVAGCWAASLFVFPVLITHDVRKYRKRRAGFAA